MNAQLNVVILAAGQGRRTKSALPEVLPPVGGRPILAHVIATAHALARTRGMAPRWTVVVGHGADEVRRAFPGRDGLDFVLQSPQLGTGHAVMQAVPHLDDSAPTLVLYGDVPLITAATLERLLDAAGGGIGLLTAATLPDPTGMAASCATGTTTCSGSSSRRTRTATNSPSRRSTPASSWCPRRSSSCWLGRLSNDNAQGEYYLTDVITQFRWHKPPEP